MGRFALALAAIVILTLSAWPLPSHSQAMPQNTGAARAASLQSSASFRAELMPLKRAPLSITTQHAPNEEPPAPALLVYLGLILVGSVGSVALARRRLHG